MKKLVLIILSFVLSVSCIYIPAYAENADFISIDVQVEWDDFRDEYGNRPDEITVNLIRSSSDSDEITVGSLVLNEADDWKGVFENLPRKSENNADFIYNVSCDTIPEYTSQTIGRLTPEAVLETALSQVGYFEKASNFALDDNTLNTGTEDWTKYARDIDKYYPLWYTGNKNGYGWCDVFADWCFIKTFGYRNALDLLCQPEKSAGAICYYSLKYFKDNGQFYTENPQPGDQIFFGTSLNNVTHVGIVEKIDDKYLYTIEGNASSRVKSIRRRLPVADIVGYGRPDYDTADSYVTSFTIINTLKTSKYSAEIVWNDSGYEENRPENVNVNLLNGDDVFETISLPVNKFSEYRWYNIPEYINGAPVEYTVTSEDIQEYELISSCLDGNYSFSYNYSPYVPVRGDINGDKKVNIEDVSHLLRSLMFDEVVNQTFDFNNDGAENIDDVSFFLKALLLSESFSL